MFRVLVNWAEEHQITSADDADRLCARLADLAVFTAHATGPGGEGGGTLGVIVESGRGLVSFLDLGRGVKLASRDADCPARHIVSLRNDDYPELQLEGIEVEARELIAPARAIAILRQFLVTGEPVDLVAWPPADEANPNAPVRRPQ